MTSCTTSRINTAFIVHLNGGNLDSNHWSKHHFRLGIETIMTIFIMSLDISAISPTVGVSHAFWPHSDQVLKRKLNYA